MITRLKHLYDSLNIVMILALAQEFFSGIYAQFSLIFTERNQMMAIFPLEL